MWGFYKIQNIFPVVSKHVTHNWEKYNGQHYSRFSQERNWIYRMFKKPNTLCWFLLSTESYYKSSLFPVEQTLLTILCLNACTSLLTFYWLSSDTETCTGAPLKVYSNLKFTHDGKYVVVQFFSLVQFFLNWYRIYWTGTKLQLTTVELKLIPGRQVDKK